MDFKKLTPTELNLLRSSLRCAFDSLDSVIGRQVDPDMCVGHASGNDEDVEVSIAEVTSMLLHMVVDLNNEEDRREVKNV